MAGVDNIRNQLIDKILTIRNKQFLEALDKLISVGSTDEEFVELTEEQVLMLKLSDADVKKGRTISQDSLKRKTNTWLRKA